MQPTTKAYLQMHSAVFLFGFTAILGKLISLEAVALVWNRLWIAIVALSFLPQVLRSLWALNRAQFITFAGIGILVALHWLTFYGSIKLGNNASVTLSCFATTALFTSFLEPWITGSKFNPMESLLGLVIILGIYFVLGVGEAYTLAILVGLLSAFLAALFSVLNKRFMGEANSVSVSFIELTSGLLFISLCYPLIQAYLPQEHWWPDRMDWLWLILLGVLCTSVAYVLALSSLRHLSAFVANLSINLEPVYGILLAILLLQEDQDLNTSFYLGTGIILFAVLMHPILLRIQKRRRKGEIPA